MKTFLLLLALCFLTADIATAGQGPGGDRGTTGQRPGGETGNGKLKL